MAERLRRAVVEDSQPTILEAGRPLSLSLGLVRYPFSAAFPELLTWDHCLALADHALYRAKRAGRNRWQCYRTNEDQLRNAIQARGIEDVRHLLRMHPGQAIRDGPDRGHRPGGFGRAGLVEPRLRQHRVFSRGPPNLHCKHGDLTLTAFSLITCRNLSTQLAACVLANDGQTSGMKAAVDYRRDGVHLGQKSVVPMRRLELPCNRTAHRQPRSASPDHARRSAGNSQSDEIPTSETCALIRCNASASDEYPRPRSNVSIAFEITR